MHGSYYETCTLTTSKARAPDSYFLRGKKHESTAKRQHLFQMEADEYLLSFVETGKKSSQFEMRKKAARENTRTQSI